jgi:colanic acid/amylovoran biosynthesis glycosyltransferase
MTATRTRVAAHVVETPGQLTEAWIDAQISGHRYRGRVYATSQLAQPYTWKNAAVRLLPITRPLVRSAHRVHLDPHPMHSAAISRFAFRGEEPDVMHCHFGPVASLMSRFGSRRRVPMIASFYGYDASQSWVHTPRWRRRYGRLFETAGAVIVEGPAMAAKVAGLGCPESKIKVIRLPYSNVDLRVSTTHKQFAAVMAGRFVEKKGFVVGLRAFALASRGGERLLVIGSGPLEGDLRSLAATSGIADRVDFRPPMPLADLADMFQRAEVALFPSHRATDGDSEGGAPMTITLAQAVGVPVIVTDHDDLPFAAAPGTLVVDAGNEVALGDALRGVLDDDAYRGRRSVEGRQFVEREHAASHLRTAREAVYDGVLRSG